MSEIIEISDNNTNNDSELIKQNVLTDKEILHLNEYDWSHSKDSLIKLWKEKAIKFEKMHKESYNYYSNKESFLRTNIIILMGIATARNSLAETFVQLDMSKKWINLGIGIINTTCVILESIVNYNQNATKKELHKKARLSWTKYITRLQLTEALLYEEREDAKLYLINCRSQFLDLLEESPQIPDYVYQNFNI